jgi:hypothetical protein
MAVTYLSGTAYSNYTVDYSTMVNATSPGTLFSTPIDYRNVVIRGNPPYLINGMDLGLNPSTAQYLTIGPLNDTTDYTQGGYGPYINGEFVYTKITDDTTNYQRTTGLYTNLTNVNYTAATTGWFVPQQNQKEIKRYQLKSKLIISVKSRAQLVRGVSAAEQTAIQTLREMISESDFRRYIKYGFLMVRGSSGDMFQVFRENWKTKVYRDGELIEEVCVRIKDSNVPPTDNVIAFKTIIESDDEAFRAMGNRFKIQRVGDFTISEQNIYQIAA